MERFYGYRYDAANRLLQGDYVARAGTSQTWSGERSNHRFWAASYDANGNLHTLRRRGLVQTGTRLAPALYAETDHLRYRYDPAQSGNRLLAVTDLAPAPTLFAASRQPERVDFKDVAGTTDYAYDVNGSLTSDQNKKLTSIRYNHLHLPEKLVFATATAGVLDSLRFVYSAAGQKVAKLVYDHHQPGVVRTDYLGAFQYEADTLRWLTTATGRALRTLDRTSGAVSFNYEHTIKDHLGNLRLSFRRGEPKSYHASLEQEPTALALQRRQFDPASVSQPVANREQAASGSYSAKLFAHGDHPQPIGPTRLWAVQGGDTLRVEVAAHYLQPVSSNPWHFALPTFLAGYLSQPTPGTNPDGSSTTRHFNWLQVGLAAGLSQLPSFGAGVPRAYLRLLVYQADSTVIQDRIVPITSAALMTWEPIVLPRFQLPTGAAYAQVYVANESNVPVWFDDLRIEHWPGLRVQENHYDPFGLALVGLDQATPGLRPLNQYQWNGKEKQADFGLNWTHLDWRFFDPQTGRFHAVDPLADVGQEMWSTYQFGFDNALRYNDPDGRNPGGGLPDDFVARGFFGVGMSAVNLVALSWAVVLDTPYKYQQNFVENSSGTAVDVETRKVPREAPLQELKSAAWDVFNVTLAAAGGGGQGKLFEQAAGRAGAAAIGQEARAMKVLTKQVNQTAADLKATGKSPATVSGGRLPNGDKVVAPSGSVPSSVPAKLAKAAKPVGGVGAKNAGNTVGCCGEFQVGTKLLQRNPGYSPTDIQFAPTVRPRTGQVVPPCENCATMFGIK